MKEMTSQYESDQSLGLNRGDTADLASLEGDNMIKLNNQNNNNNRKIKLFLDYNKELKNAEEKLRFLVRTQLKELIKLGINKRIARIIILQRLNPEINVPDKSEVEKILANYGSIGIKEDQIVQALILRDEIRKLRNPEKENLNRLAAIDYLTAKLEKSSFLDNKAEYDETALGKLYEKVFQNSGRKLKLNSRGKPLSEAEQMKLEFDKMVEVKKRLIKLDEFDVDLDLGLNGLGKENRKNTAGQTRKSKRLKRKLNDNNVNLSVRSTDSSESSASKKNNPQKKRKKKL